MKLTLKQARRLKDESQKNLAEILNVTVKTYRRLEKNPNLITIEQARKISDYLEIPCDEIFFASNYSI